MCAMASVVCIVMGTPCCHKAAVLRGCASGVNTMGVLANAT